MRYHFIPLGLVLLLAACGQDPTGPGTTPQVDIGGDFPKADPGKVPILCVKPQLRAIASAENSGVDELRNHPDPVCTVQ
jgi:hypothetical protein